MARKRTRPRLPGVHTVRSRGKLYFYAFRGGMRLPDPDVDPIGFVDAYREAHQLKPTTTDQANAEVSTVAQLAEAYRQSGDFERLAPSTQKLYRAVLTSVEERFGALPLVALKAERMPSQIRRWRDEISDRPRAADTRVEVLSTLCQWGVRYGFVSKNPARGVEGIHRSNRSDVIWTDDELRRLIDAATPECGRAIIVAAYTGLRLGDIIGLTWDDVDLEAGLVDRVTNKSRGRTRATPPLLPEALTALETAPKIASTVLTSGLRRPWTQSGLGNAFRDARNEIGVNKRFHDLRGTAATRFAIAGFGAQQIAGFMGWEEGRVAAIIKRYVSRRKVAEEAAKRLRGESEETP
jgi:integrase